jgi:hypothetical protein
MSTDDLRKPKVLIGALAVLLLAGVVWGVTVHVRNKKNAIPKEFTVEALKSESDPGKMFQKVHEAMDRKDLTPAQREEIHQNARNAMDARMDARMDEYFNAPAAQKQAILDRHLDEMQVRMKDWEKRRAERDAQEKAAGSSQSSAPGGNASGGDGGRRWGGRDGQGPTREERKAHSEARNPEQSARRMAYFTAMSSRAQQRGIQMPFSGRGRGN